MLPRSSIWEELESSYFYAMEFVEGETLENLIKRSGRLEVKLALEIATQVAAGLAAVHKQKLVHRDIKPEAPAYCAHQACTTMITAKAGIHLLQSQG